MKILAVLIVLTLPFVAGSQEKASGKKMVKQAQEAVKAAETSAMEVVSQEVEGTTLHGYVVDAMCAKGMAKNSTTVMKKAAAHTKSCALEEACASSGFGVFSDAKWYKFDEAGDKQALELIKGTKKDKGLMVTVSGSMQEGTLMVSSLAEHAGDAKGKKSEKKKDHDHDHDH